MGRRSILLTGSVRAGRPILGTRSTWATDRGSGGTSGHDDIMCVLVRSPVADLGYLSPVENPRLHSSSPLLMRDRMATGTVRGQWAAPCRSCRTGTARRVQRGPPKGASPLRDVASLHGGGVAFVTRLCCRRLRASRRAGGSPAEEEWTNWVRKSRAGR